MTRNWGGDGIEKFLEPDEKLLLRFSNYFLTNSRFGIYLPLSSNFEFLNLSEISLRERSGRSLMPAVAATLSGLSTLFAIAIILDPINIVGELISFSVVFFTAVYGLSILVKFNKDSYLVTSLNAKKSFKVRTFQSKEGLVFVEELVNAVNIKKIVNNSDGQ